MPRSVGVIISAIIVFIGCAFTILFGAFAIFGALIGSKLGRVPNAPPHFQTLILVEAIVFLALGGWGIASGIGILNSKEWARISMIVFSVLLVFCFLPSALLMAFIPLPVPNDPNLPSNFAFAVKIAVCSSFGVLAALGAFWLYFFNKRSVKARFQGREVPVEVAPTPSPVQMPAAIPSARPGASARPLSITIIGWFLLVGSPLGILGALYSRSMFPGVQMPMCFVGFFVFGRSATIILLVWMVVQMIAAVGLLKLENWGRLATIVLQLLGILNMLLIVGVPANRLRFQQIMDSAMASMNAGMPQPAPFVFPAWAMMVASLPIFVVILWFLFTRRQAFTSPAHERVRLL